ncbi:MAG: PAS domain S-box protein [Magnetococcales bacterium]|nr:PAS domain S-box protein [Magnetococcales bacterium]
MTHLPVAPPENHMPRFNPIDPAFFRKIVSRILPNTLIFLAIFLPALIVTANFDVFDVLIRLVRQYDVWYLDEVLSMLILCFVPFLSYATWRLFHLNTTLRSNEETILGLNRQNEMILNAAAEGIFGLDRSGRTTFINSSAARMLGRGRQELMGRYCREFVFSPKAPAKAENPIRDTFTNGNHHLVEEASFHRADGAEFPVEYTSTPIFQRGRVVGAVITFRDITERKRTQAELDRLAKAIEQTADMVIITDTQGVVQYVNAAFEWITGFTREEALGKNPRFLKIGEEPFFGQMWSEVQNGRIWKDRFWSQAKDGTAFHADTTVSPIRDRQGKVSHLMAVTRDVTRESQLGAQLRHSQKLEAVGTLAGGIAHDFSNILTAIINYTELTMDDVDEGSLAFGNLNEVLVAAQRAKGLTTHLLTFSRRGEEKLAPIALEPVIAEAVKLLQALLPATLKMEVTLQEVGQVLADATQIHQVVMNLCMNAAQAMRGREGLMALRLEGISVDKQFAHRHSLPKTGAYAALTVQDTGVGITPEGLERIFEPFYSTKPVGRGTGLGLAVVHGIVQNHGGAISVESVPGKGSTFQIFLPQLTAEDEAAG